MRRRLPMERVLLIAVLAAGCAGRIPIPPESAEHPASPQAPAAAVPGPSQPLAPDRFDRSPSERLEGEETMAPSGGHPHGHHGEPASPTATPGTSMYTCPMHPEVIELNPGSCPKCGMTLVPKREEKE